VGVAKKCHFNIDIHAQMGNFYSSGQNGVENEAKWEIPVSTYFNMMHPCLRDDDVTSDMRKGNGLLIATLAANSLFIAVAIFLGIRSGDIDRHFDEHQFITFVSVIQLAGAALLAARILLLRAWNKERYGWRTRRIFWALVTLGFLFLAVDDLGAVHEGIDHKIHAIFSVYETNVTTRLDDVIVLAYGLAGVSVLYVFRKEARVFAPYAAPYLVGALSLFGVMVGLDIVTHEPDLIRAEHIRVLLGVAEEGCKLFAECFFLAGLYRCVLFALACSSDPA
jgi:hypothetical protein